jgi:hypothetical protein
MAKMKNSTVALILLSAISILPSVGFCSDNTGIVIKTVKKIPLQLDKQDIGVVNHANFNFEDGNAGQAGVERATKKALDSMHSFLNFGPVKELRRSVQVEDGKEILIAEFAPKREDEAFIRVYLRDEPKLIVAYLQVDPMFLNNPENLKHWLAKSVKEQSDPLQIENISVLFLSVDSPGQIRMRGGFHLKHEPSVIDPKLDALQYLGFTVGDKSYIAFVIGKRSLSGIYSAEDRVDERFPPLTQKIKSWSTEKILGQMNEDEDRNQILISELLERKLSDEQFRLLVLGPHPQKSMSRRLQLLLFNLRKKNKLSEFESLFVHLVKSIGLNGSEFEMNTLLQNARLVPEIDLTHEVLELIKRTGGSRVEIEYLQERGRTNEIANELENIKVPDALEGPRKNAVLIIKSRALASSKR